MRDSHLRAGGALVVLAVASACRAPEPGRGHSHNDYLHAQPLHEALAAGCVSVEADVFLVGGELRLGHERALLRPGTLQSLYLDPLCARARDHGGFVQRRGEPFWLLIDIKADGVRVLERLGELLAERRPWFTCWRDNEVVPGAITVVLSGDRPRAPVAVIRERRCAIDGRLPDLDDDPPAVLVPWISDAWSRAFTWDGAGPMPDEERARLRALAARAHAQGRLLRFWGAPDRAEVWAELLAAGVDLIGTDRPLAFAQWLARR